jgi:hypothetical protein
LKLGGLLSLKHRARITKKQDFANKMKKKGNAREVRNNI